MQPEYAFCLLSKPRDICSFHLYASFLLLSAAGNYIITARPHFAHFLLQFLLSFAFPAAQQFGEVYSIFLHINRSFYLKINQTNGLKIDEF